MSERIWDGLKGDKIAPNLQLRDLLFSDAKHAVFRADYTDAADGMREVQVQVFLDDARYAGERVNRFLEAKYFEDPHLLHYLGAGTLPREESTLSYAIIEGTDGWGSGSLAAGDVLSFARHVLSGLEYLHRRDLVYCVLSPETVVSVGAEWKLSDFSQLRVAGTDTSDEALSLARTLDTCPPEALEGEITPAWDVWSFGQTLRRVVENSETHLVDPFRAVFLACVNINPSSRPSLSQISGLLEEKRGSSQRAAISSAAKA